MYLEAGDTLYAGVLVTARNIRLIFGYSSNRNISNELQFSSSELFPYAAGEYDREFPITRETIEQYLKEVSTHICNLPDLVKRIGVGSYGPMLSVDIEYRDRKHKNYGKITDTATHASLAGVAVYQILRDQLDTFGVTGQSIELIMQTDVVCGAISETLLRSGKAKLKERERQHRITDTLVFLNFSDGVGGGFVNASKPWRSAAPSEIGFTAAQVIPGDTWAENKFPHKDSRVHPVFIEELVSTEALLKRSGVEKIEDIRKPEWELTAEYVAQLCATVCLVLAPHQLVLHGDRFELAQDENGNKIDVLELVRLKLKIWLSTGKGLHISYYELTESPIFLDVPIWKSWAISEDSDISISPMEYGTLVFAMQPNVIQHEKTND